MQIPLVQCAVLVDDDRPGFVPGSGGVREATEAFSLGDQTKHALAVR